MASVDTTRSRQLQKARTLVVRSPAGAVAYADGRFVCRIHPRDFAGALYDAGAATHAIAQVRVLECAQLPQVFPVALEQLEREIARRARAGGGRTH